MLMRFWRPIPPIPTPAMFSRSLGGVKPRPRTCLGTRAAAALPAAAVLRNLRRVSPVFLSLPSQVACDLVSAFSTGPFLLMASPSSLAPRRHAYYASLCKRWRPLIFSCPVLCLLATGSLLERKCEYEACNLLEDSVWV